MAGHYVATVDDTEPNPVFEHTLAVSVGKLFGLHRRWPEFKSRSAVEVGPNQGPQSSVSRRSTRSLLEVQEHLPHHPNVAELDEN